MPNVEGLTIGEQGYSAIHQSGEFSIELCSKLRKVTLWSFEKEMSIAIVIGFLGRLKSLEMIVFESCSLGETD